MSYERTRLGQQPASGRRVRRAVRAPVVSAAAGSATLRAANAQREPAMEPTAAESSRATVHDAISMAASTVPIWYSIYFFKRPYLST